MFSFVAKRFASPSTTSAYHPINPRVWVQSLFAVILLVCYGCGDSPTTTAPGTQARSNPFSGNPELDPGQSDPLADVLRFAETGDLDAAIEQFVAGAPANWLEATALEEFQMSEADFAGLGRADRNRIQQQAIDRVSEIKRLARAVIDEATEAAKRGDEETAERYVEAVRRFGRQLRDSDSLVVFQQTGNALANASL
jgi:hypothetical protein